MAWTRDSCLARVTTGVAVGGAVGGAVGAVYGTYEAIRYKVAVMVPVMAYMVDICHYNGILRLPLVLANNSIKSTSVLLCCILFYAASYRCALDSQFSIDAILTQVPGLLKIRYIGQTTIGSAAIFGLFLGAGSLIHCGKSY
ncbi:Romo1/Mgr2 [Dillenia turbinata]|uniref:Romo1/Mgr2 n=1 Tax=Dillenia turbinata TaxID=194707 RepID=A0AAN8VWM4_9MAGN